MKPLSNFARLQTDAFPVKDNHPGVFSKAQLHMSLKSRHPILQHTAAISPMHWMKAKNQCSQLSADMWLGTLVSRDRIHASLAIF